MAIVGAGYTGLWTAYYLATLEPGLRVVVLEREYAGFGASGRNGGWCSALFPMSWQRVARASSPAAADALRGALAGAVDEVGTVTAAQGLDVHYAKGGTLTLATDPAHLPRLRARDGVDGARWLPADEAAARVGAAGVLGAVHQPQCAALHPGLLVRGLANLVERLGVTLHEGTPVLALRPGVALTPHGRVRAEVVVRATEGWTPELAGQRRALVPVYSLVIATEPLPASFWSAVGWRSRETVTDGRHLLVYAQRTAGGRVVFGGRGAPYHFGSRVRPAFDLSPRVFALLERALVGLFPGLAAARVTHRWGGPLGVPRDWFPSVGFDARAGLAWGGGYVGDGVAASNLAGRTLADLILRRDTDLAALPWVGHRSPRWEPEPLRWLGVNATRLLLASADAGESRTHRPARRAALLAPLLGE